jgi:uncharacterized DUF497 family protein
MPEDSFFEWDPAKNKANIAKHEIDFNDAKAIFDRYTVEMEDTRKDYGEKRIQAIGKLRSGVILVVYTERGTKIRIISAREATSWERKIYDDALQDELGKARKKKR